MKDITVVFSQTLSDPENTRKPKGMQWDFTCQVINIQQGKLQSPPHIIIGIIMTLNTSGKGSLSDLCEGRTESSPVKGNQLSPGLSNNSASQWEPYCPSGKAKIGPPKVYQSGLRLLWGTGDLKGQIPVPMCIRYQNWVTTATAAGPCFLFRWDGPDSHQYLS